MHSFTSILLVTKARHEHAEQSALQIQQWLNARSVATALISADVDEALLIEAASHCQAALIFGGDGTLVGAGRKLASLDIPLLGINFGQVGFLAELPFSLWEQTLEKLVTGNLPVVSRPLLKWSVQRHAVQIREGYAVNDIVVGRGAVARVLPIRVSVDDVSLGSIRSDGLIISTPLGTSAYALSAHGALVHPDIPALALTPISPFFRSFPPMLLPERSRIILEPGSSDALLTVDGQEGIALELGDRVCTTTMVNALKLFSIEECGYFQRLCDRGFIQTRSEAPKDPLSAIL